MFSVAVCDNEKSICDQMEAFFYAYGEEQGFALDVMRFTSGEDLAKAMENGISFDLIFLDIELFALSGIDVARWLREEKGDLFTQIVYISAKQEYAMELFATHPLDFLVKPLGREGVFRVLHRALEMKNKRGEVFSYRTGTDVRRTQLTNILYFESKNRKVRMVRFGGSEEFYAKLNEVEADLANHSFLRIHKSYLVNLAYVNAFRSGEVEMVNGDVLHVSREHQKAVAAAILCKKFKEEMK